MCRGKTDHMMAKKGKATKGTIVYKYIKHNLYIKYQTEQRIVFIECRYHL